MGATTTPDVINSPECMVILNDYQNACDSAKVIMNITSVSLSLNDLFNEMLDKVVTLKQTPSLEKLKLLVKGRDYLHGCYRGRSKYIHECVPSGRRTPRQRRSDRGHEHAKNVFKKIWNSYNKDVRIMMSLISETELIDQAITDMTNDISSQTLHDVTQFLMGILEGERVTEIGRGKLRWSLYSKYTPTKEEYHHLLSLCKYDQTMVLSVIKVLHFFEYHDIDLDRTRIFDLIHRASKSDLLWSFLTLRRTDSFLRELIIQVGNQSYLSVSDMVRNLEDILDDPALVTVLMSNGVPSLLDGITLTLSNLSLVIRKDETSFELHKLHLSNIVKHGKDIEDSDWDKLAKLEKMSLVKDIVSSARFGFIKSRGDYIFELFQEVPRHGENNATPLVRGDYDISDEGDVTIKTTGLNLDGIKYIILPLDTLHMKKYAGESRVLSMNNVSRVSRSGKVVPLDIPVRHFPEFTLTNIDDVNFVTM